jgi:hypothetical protein
VSGVGSGRVGTDRVGLDFRFVRVIVSKFFSLVGFGMGLVG